MNKLLCLLLLLPATLAYAQNKTLGVGTTTPNPNAALHVESPTNNQGFIMPRLTTAQKGAMAGILSAADEGVMVYDTDMNAIQIWSGSAWAGLAKLQYPYVDTITSLPAGSNALRIVYNSTDVGNFGVAHFENMNPNSGFTPLFVRTNSATNGATDMVINNAANTNDVIGATTNGLGTGGSFRVNNAANDSSALQAITNGTGQAIMGINNGTAHAGIFRNTNAASTKHALYAVSNGDTLSAAIHGNNTGNGFGVFGKSSGTDFASAAVYGEHVGTGDAAGAFRISNPSSIYSGLYGETNGSGPAIYGQNIGTGYAANFFVNNPSNTAAALRVRTNGKGQVANFTQMDTTSTAYAVFVNSVGGTGVFTNHNGSTGYAGVFQSIKPANTTPALYAEAVGTGASVWALKSTDAVGGDALLAENWIASGSAARFKMTEVENTSPAVVIENQGKGDGLEVTVSPSDTSYMAGIRSINNSFGNAGFFVTSNSNSPSPAIYSASNSWNGVIEANQSGTVGPVARLSIGDPTNTSAAIEINHNGAGNAITANRPIQATQFIGDGSALTNLPAISLPFTSTTSSASPLFEVNASGTASAGRFINSNASNTFHALYAESNGDTLSAAVHGNNIGNGFGVFGRAAGNDFASAAVYGEHVGTGDAAGAFRISNPANTYSGLYGETNGSGSALFANNIGTGRGAQIQINNAANNSAALRSFTNGLGNAGFFTINNVANDSSALYIQTNGTGNAITANAPIQATTSTGQAGVLASVGNASMGVYALTNGTNNAGRFEVNNGSSTAPAVAATTNGTAAALQLSQTNNGYALEVASGGLKLSVLDITTLPATVDTKAAFYNVTVSGTLTLGTTGRTTGETVYVSNEAGLPITVELVASGSYVFVDPGITHGFTYINGSWRPHGGTIYTP